MKKTYHFDLQSLRQKNQTQESEINSLQAGVESLRAKNLALESKSSSLATELLSRQNEVNNWMGKTQVLETELKYQTELMTAKETRILALDIGLTKANKNLSELNAKYKELQAEHISQSNFILE